MNKLLSYCGNNKKHKRFWWFRLNNYMPTCFAILDKKEQEDLIDFFEKSEQRQYIAECNVPCISFIMSLIMSNNINSILSLGHFAGYSIILMGMCMRKKSAKKSIYSIDINKSVTEFASNLIKKYDLDEYVHLEIDDSSNPMQCDKVRKYFDRKQLDLVFIDSSHTYHQTLKELRLWYPYVKLMFPSLVDKVLS